MFFFQINVLSSVTQLCLTLCDPMDCSQAFLSIINSQSLLKLMSIESVMPSNHLILGHPLLLPSSIFPSSRVFSNESALCSRWPQYWSFSFSISPSNEYSGLISFRIDWLELLAVQGILKSLLQHHSSKSINFSALGFNFFSSTTLLLPTHLPPPSCTHAQSCNPMDCNLPGSSVHGLFQARILAWVAISFSRLAFFTVQISHPYMTTGKTIALDGPLLAK